MSKQPLTDAEYVATLGTRPVCQSTELEGSSGFAPPCPDDGRE